MYDILLLQEQSNLGSASLEHIVNLGISLKVDILKGCSSGLPELTLLNLTKSKIQQFSYVM